MFDTLPTVLNLATAGEIDLASASDMVTDAMSTLDILANSGIKGAMGEFRMHKKCPEIFLKKFDVTIDITPAV